MLRSVGGGVRFNVFGLIFEAAAVRPLDLVRSKWAMTVSLRPGFWDAHVHHGRPEPALRDLDRSPTHAHAGDRAVSLSIEYGQAARPLHGDALQAQHRARLVGGHDAVLQQITAERAARAAGGGIFDDAEVRRQHPAVDGFVACRPVRSVVKTNSGSGFASRRSVMTFASARRSTMMRSTAVREASGHIQERRRRRRRSGAEDRRDR